MEASRIQFACANPEKTEKTKEILNNIISEDEAKLDFEKHRAKPKPSFLVSESIFENIHKKYVSSNILLYLSYLIQYINGGIYSFH